MPEFWFYHLESSTIESVLPALLEKTRENHWRALIKAPPDRIEALNSYLWTYREDSFLPHGRDDEPMSDRHPIVLSSSLETAQGYKAVFLVDGADMQDFAEVARCIILINGRSESDVAAERRRWKKLDGQGANLAYWQQGPHGKWQKKA